MLRCHPRRRATVAFGGLLLLGLGDAQAVCSRPIQAPMSDLGMSVVVDGTRLTGVYPTLLSELGPQAGCEFLTQAVPRARQQRLFEVAQADLMIPASRSPGRDAWGDFVPLLQVLPGALSFDRERPALRSLAQLVSQGDLRVVVVRGFSYGAAYDNAVAQLRAQQRLLEESDVQGVVRALRKGLAHVTVMAPFLLQGVLARDPAQAAQSKELRVEVLEELPWGETGAYLSRQTLTEADREQLRQALVGASRSGRLLQLFQQHYPAAVLNGTLRPLP